MYQITRLYNKVESDGSGSIDSSDQMMVSALGRFTFGLVMIVMAVFHFANTAVAAPSDQPTTRIVSLVPNLTELAFALGAGAHVVGVSDYCRWPAEATSRPSVGGLVNPGLESTLRLRPTVVLLYRSQTEFASRLRQLGIQSELLQVDTLADLQSAIGRLGTITGNTSAAATLSSGINAGLEQVKQESLSSADTGSSGVTGVVIVSRDPAGLGGMYQAATGNFLGELFEIAGGRLAIGGGAAVSREELIRANPALIIDMSGGDAGGGTSLNGPAATVGPWAELSILNAVKSRQVYQWPDPHALLLGPSVLDTARKMRTLIKMANQK